MADLQQSVVTDQDTRHQIQQQVVTWEENLERLHCEQFRLRCYMASLQCGELPNPKVIFSAILLLRFWVLNESRFGLIAVASYSRLTPDQEHFEQAGRVHRVLLPRVHLRSLSVAFEQFTCRSWCNETSPSDSVAFQQRLQPSLYAGKSLVGRAELSPSLSVIFLNR